VTAAMAQADGTPARGRLEFRCRRQAPEARLVQPLTTQPCTRGQALGARAHGGEELPDARDGRAVEVHVPGGHGEEMEVGIDQPRNHGGAAAVEHFRVPPDEPAERSAGADTEHPATADGDRLRDRLARVERHDPRIVEEPGGRRQSEDGSGFASFTFISCSQHVMLPLPALLHSISVPQVSQR